ncbi:SulP family inorganic anion transporter [Leucobacter sp. L43]|uniref:SulP family inorganic anion transporter n=1 Tax=Leucobacter sp. L43 TaxID=2798040 RepID=UPI001904B43C|nr:SulP family inorganic anion transporter [Leucobacter sp. L43]
MVTTASGRPRIFLSSLVGYRRSWVPNDVVAGLTAGAVVVPQAMAYATIAKLPVEVGLYTCIVPMLVYALLGGSRAMSVSTTSTVATLTATTLVTAGVVNEVEDQLASLVTLSLLVGGILLVARLLHLGGIVENISVATILGVKIGVGGTVLISQLPTLLGEDAVPVAEGFIHSLGAAIGALESVNSATVALSIASILVMLMMKRFTPRVPGTIVVATAGILLVWLTNIDALGIAVIDPVPSGLPVPVLPDFTHLVELIPGALAISVMVFLESATVARSLRNPHEAPIDADQELLAIGAANAVGGFFATLPAAGGLSQSAVNQGAGARSQLAALITVTFAILVALFLGPVLSMLPQAVLASMVVVAVATLIDVPLLVRWSRISPIDFWVALVVAMLGLTAGLLFAVAAGVVITLILVLRELNTPSVEEMGRRENVLILHIARGLYTANVRANAEAILDLVHTAPGAVDILILDVKRVEIMTMTVLDTLAALDSELAARGVVLHLAGLPERAVGVAAKTGWFQKLASEGRTHADVEAGPSSAAR